MPRQFVGQSTGEEFVENDAQRVDIAARVERQGIGGDLLRAHIGECAEQLSHVGLTGRLHIAVGHAGQTKIENLGLAVLLHQNVSRFQIAVDDAALMGMLDRFANLNHERESLARVQMLRFGVFD